MCGFIELAVAATALNGGYTLLNMEHERETARNQARFQAAAQRNAAAEARYAGEEMRRDAERTAGEMRRNSRAQQAGVRSLLAASGMDAGSGSALDVLQDQSTAARTGMLDMERQVERRQRALEYRAAGAESGASLLLDSLNDPWSRMQQGWRTGMIIGNTARGLNGYWQS